MFLHLSVILFTGRGLSPSMHHRSHVQGVSVSGVVSVKGVSAWVWGSLSGESLSTGVSVQGGLSGGSLSRGSLFREVSVQGHLCTGGSLSGGSLLARHPWTETPHTVTSGQYVSYWNAFLFNSNNFSGLASFSIISSIQLCKCLTINISVISSLFSTARMSLREPPP